MKIKRLVGGNLESNGYILYDKEGGEGYIIDPGYDAGGFLKACSGLSVRIKAILLTHHHYDHVGGVAKLQKELSVPVCMNRLDGDVYTGKVDHFLEDGELLLLGDEELRVLHTPGHTKGGICILSEKSRVVFTGDTIFNVDLGRTDLADGSEAEMKKSIREVVSKWENYMTIYPGHGDPATMKYVRTHNKEYLDLMK